MALERLRNMEVLGQAVGLFLTGRAQSAFSQQGRPSGSWPARAAVNRIGILLDLQQGKTPPARRFQPRPAGIDTGRLRSSITYGVTHTASLGGGGASTTVTVGTNVAYAGDVQKGSSKTITVDGSLRRALADWLRSLTGSQKVAMRKSFGFLFTTGSITVNVPPRPFLVLTPEDRQKINDMAQKFYATGGVS